MLILQVSDDVYSALRRRAEADGTSPALVAATSLEQQFGVAHTPQDSRRMSTAADHEAAIERFRHHIGAVDLGAATGADNESIDADLVREYADTHEPA